MREAITRAIATIPDTSLRAAVKAAPCKALIGFRTSADHIPAQPVGVVWMPSGPVPPADPPIAAIMMAEMLARMQDSYSVMLVTNDRASLDRACAYLRAAVDALGLSADAPPDGAPS